MSYHIVNIDTPEAYITCRHGQLVCDDGCGKTKQLPLEDVCAIIITSFSSTVHSRLLNEAAKLGVSIIFCENFKPQSILMPANRITDTVLAKSFIENLEVKGITADVAVGFPANDMNGLAISLRSARDAMRLGGLLKMNGVVSARSLTSEALLDMLPVGKREEFAHRTLAGLEGRSDYEEMRDTFLGWCESPFASGEVAERLSMHRNSLQYRLKKIRALTGKDPWNFKDAFELWAAFVLKNISEEEKS